jgi:hypothetical protein
MRHVEVCKGAANRQSEDVTRPGSTSFVCSLENLYKV